MSVTAVFLFTSCIGRVAYICFSKAYKVSDSYNSYTVLLAHADVNFYYRDDFRITNNAEKTVAVIRPTDRDIKECYRLFHGEKLNYILSSLSDGKPLVIETDKPLQSSVINSYTVRDSIYSARQLISRDSGGLLMHMPKSGAKLELNCRIDAAGRFLSGDKGSLKNTDYYSNKGYKLSLDKDIQSVADTAMKAIPSGCMLIMNVKDGSILAAVTKPVSSNTNKCFNLYSVGSVFKIVSAYSSLEKGLDLQYECKGKIKLGDTVFSCHHKKAHGKQNLKEALANSCNCYFVNLSKHLSERDLYRVAEKFGFNDSTKLCNGWTVKNASLPSHAKLNSKGEKALFSFGQGKLLSTPIQICSMLCTLANGGEKNEPSLIMGEFDEAMKLTEYKKKSEQALNPAYSKILRSYLKYAVENGTGIAANYNNQTAGKTATAQTGQYENGKEKLNAWFAGVYPYDNPEYAIVIMCENGVSGSENCCPVFRTVVEMLDKM